LSARLDGYSPLAYRDEVNVAQGKTTASEIVLDPHVRVSGVATDEAGRPVAAATVSGASAPTDQAGRSEARFPGDDPPAAWIARQTQRNLAAIILTQDFGESPRTTLRPAMSVRGTVTDPNGRGIPAARLALCLRIPGALMPYAPEIVTDAEGFGVGELDEPLAAAEPS